MSSSQHLSRPVSRPEPQPEPTALAPGPGIGHGANAPADAGLQSTCQWESYDLAILDAILES